MVFGLQETNFNYMVCHKPLNKPCIKTITLSALRYNLKNYLDYLSNTDYVVVIFEIKTKRILW
ncbi:MAG: hypothetical protein EAZ15_08225 [Sphingobacteriales bacterium]|nr:MAG: hypothetical protein EAZ15_08225 [Sphingobacteriales bacterium]